MKFSTVFAGALATIASAAPTTTTTDLTAAAEKRGAFDASSLNNLAFNSLNLGYLNAINSLNVNQLQQLAVNNNLNALAFQSLFSASSFSVDNILQLQQLQTLLQLQQLGVFNNAAVDLSGLNLQVLQLGLVQGVGAFDLGSLVDASLVPQITTVVQQQQQKQGGTCTRAQRRS